MVVYMKGAISRIDQLGYVTHDSDEIAAPPNG